MADVFAPKKRSEIMSRVRGQGNLTTEIRLIGIFRAYGITGWRRHIAMFGHPDFVFPAARLAVFVDGCFWHGCPIHGSIPTSNRAFWARKLDLNKKRDKLVCRRLNASGWRVLRFWQHDLRQPKKVSRRLMRSLDPVS